MCRNTFLRVLSGGSDFVVFTVLSYGLAEPVHTLSFFPLALLFHSIFGCVLDTKSMLLVVDPSADVLVPVGQSHGALAILEPTREVAVVNTPIGKLKSSLAFKDVVAELTLVCSLTLGEEVNAVARELAIVELAIVV